jgi:CHASE2 domain-containing sensor protein
MSQRNRSGKAKRSRWFTYLWIFALAVLIFGLLWKEQTSLLYILATLGVTILLVIVAIADLGQSVQPPTTIALPDLPPQPRVKARK